MSQGDLYRILKKVEKNLSKKSGAFRREIADKQPHIFSVNTEQVKVELKKQLLRKFGGYRGSNTRLPPSLEKVVEEDVPKFTQILYNSFANTKFLRSFEYSNLVGTPQDFTVTVESKTGTGSVFGKIKNIKQSAQRPLIGSLNRALSSMGRDQKIEKDTFLELGHEKGLSIEQAEQALDEIGEVLKDIQTKPKTSEFNKVVQDLRKLGIRIGLSSNWPGDVKEFVVNIQLEAASFNRHTVSSGSEGKGEAGVVAELRKELEQVLRDYPEWEHQSTSDSKILQTEKAVIQTLNRTIKDTKTVDKNFDKVLLKRINKSPSKAQGKVKRPKVKAVPVNTSILDLSQVRPEQRRQQAGQGLLRLQFLINERLPPTVRKNMVFPALVNRTGRFAESTKVTDIILTPKGFPSIGYTYQKDPYQVFEMTAGKEPWATPDRDPRKIIDRSIREIAAEYLAGRFFTRRV